MSKVHFLKIKDVYLTDILLGRKRFELRKNDRNYKVGDLIYFIDVDGSPFTFPVPYFIITYILSDVPQYGLSELYVILGIEAFFSDFRGMYND